MVDSRSTTPTLLGSIKLSYSQPLSDDKVAELEQNIVQAGLKNHQVRRYTCEVFGRLDHVVEIVARYDDLSSEEWSDLCEKVVETYYYPPELGSVLYQMWKKL